MGVLVLSPGLFIMINRDFKRILWHRRRLLTGVNIVIIAIITIAVIYAMNRLPLVRRNYNIIFYYERLGDF